jgi:hypothetical protein
LLNLDVESANPDAQTPGWETAVTEFVTSVLTAALVERRYKFFNRTLFFYIGAQVDGEYWLRGYRFAPAFPDDAEPFLVNAERVVAVDQDVYGIDQLHSQTVATEAALRHAARLSLLLNTGLYSAQAVQRWFYPVPADPPGSPSVRRQLGFFHPQMGVASMPRKGELCSLGAYKGSLAARYRVGGEMLSLPLEARRILRGIDSAAPLISDAFDRAARLYQVATVAGMSFPTLGLAYRVAAVDVISKTDPDSANFSAFMRRHVSSQPNIDAVLKYLYGDVRSAHFHAGEFAMGEFGPDLFRFDAFMDSDYLQRDALHRTCFELTREAIVNWLNAVTPEIPESADPEP